MAIVTGLLPPTGWADVATKRDLDVLELRLRDEIRGVELRFERALQSLTMWLVETMIAVATIALVIARVT
jgi:hypothetical protein